MCERRDSIAQVSAAADRLLEICEAEIHGPVHPEPSGISKALRTALHDIDTTPLDMAAQLGRIK